MARYHDTYPPPHPRSNLLNLRSPDYEGGWCDVDFKIVQACFNLLRQYVEVERGLRAIVWASHDQKTVKREIQALYYWWTVTRPRRPDKDCLFAGYDEDQEMLLRLIAIRRALWV